MARNWLKDRREKLKMSQDELASALQLRGIDVTRATISHWEADRYNPPFNDPEFVNSIAGILKLSVLDVLTAAGYKISIENLTDDERHIIEAIRRGDKVEAIKAIVNEY